MATAVPAADLIYSAARRGGIGVLIMLAGASGSGKTKSALRLATGLANGGPIFFCDTEHGRALIYADDFSFQHLSLKEPFNPHRFEAAAVAAQKAGAAVWICDSFSHEHVGPGGVLDMFEAELTRMTKGDESKREALKYAAWIKPKMEHKHLLQRLWQLNCHVILCTHGEKKLELIKNDRGKMVPNPDATPSAVCSPDIPFAMTASFILDARNPGVPGWMKRLDKWDPLVALDRPLDEATGERIGAWARGEKQAEPKPKQAPARPLVSMDNPHGDEPPPREDPPPADDSFPGDIPLKPAGQQLDLINGAAKTAGKTQATLNDLLTRFSGVQTRADYLAIVDRKTERDKIDWYKKNRPQMHAQLDAVMKASWARTEQPE
jgi:hypothetical protein